MIIANNIMGLNALNQLKKNEGKVSTGIQRLSSGLRINKASDDAAGLSISEGMRAQIRGLNQAERNIQDGISLIQTAEAGLGEIENPNLQRLRELAVQAANGTLSSEDRQQIQEEIEQIKAGIDDIANNTEFNNTKVLRPPVEKVQNPLPPQPGGKADIVFVVDNTGSMSGTQTEVANNIENFIDSIVSKGVTDIRMGVVEYTDYVLDAKSFSGSKWTSSSEDIKNALLDLAGSNNGGIENAMGALQYTASNYDFRNHENSDVQLKHVILVTNEDADDEGQLASTLSEMQSKKIQVHGVYQTDNTDVSEFNEIISMTGGKALNLNNSNWGSELNTIIGSHIGDVGNSGGTNTEEEEPITVHLQVGANAGQTYPVKLFDARTTKLGISDIEIDPVEKAIEALNKIDSAMIKVSAARGKFGSHQNALEHIHNNVSNYKENLSAAESQIRDADMAKEIMDLTKHKILMQSSQAMLSQANQAPQSVLQLLQSK